MEQIPMEVIEMADNFFKDKSDDEFDEIFKLYCEEQPALQILVVNTIKNISNQDVLRDCVKMYVTIYRSFKFYNIGLPLISLETIIETCDTYLHSFIQKKGLQINPNDMFEDMKSYLNQSNLLHYSFIKIFGTNDDPVKYKMHTDWFNYFFLTASIIIIMNNETRKFIDKDLN